MGTVSMLLLIFLNNQVNQCIRRNSHCRIVPMDYVDTSGMEYSRMEKQSPLLKQRLCIAASFPRCSPQVERGEGVCLHNGETWQIPLQPGDMSRHESSEYDSMKMMPACDRPPQNSHLRLLIRKAQVTPIQGHPKDCLTSSLSNCQGIQTSNSEKPSGTQRITKCKCG